MSWLHEGNCQIWATLYCSRGPILHPYFSSCSPRFFSKYPQLPCGLHWWADPWETQGMVLLPAYHGFTNPARYFSAHNERPGLYYSHPISPLDVRKLSKKDSSSHPVCCAHLFLSNSWVFIFYNIFTII